MQEVEYCPYLKYAKGGWVSFPPTTEALDKGLQPGSAQLLLVCLLKGGRTERGFLRTDFCDLCGPSHRTCWGPRRGKMVAYVTLFAVSLEVERGLSRERMPRALSGFVWNSPLLSPL